jgi:hypothetical protein
MNKKNGISLVILVVTIIVMSILAGVALSLVSETNWIEVAKSAFLEWQVKDIKERVEETYSLMASENIGSPRGITANDVIDRLVSEGVPLDTLGEIYFDIIDTNIIIGALENAPTYRNKKKNIFNK